MLKCQNTMCKCKNINDEMLKGYLKHANMMKGQNDDFYHFTFILLSTNYSAVLN